MRRPLFLRMLRSCSGVAAVEFALISPLLIAMFFGLYELSNALECRTDVINMANNTADLAAQSVSLSNSDVSNIFDAASSVLYPYTSSGVKIVISSVVDDGHGHATVAWSDTRNGSARAVGSSVNVPAGVLPSNGSVILAEVTYPYSSPTTVEITGRITMSATAYALPRLSTQVARVP